MEMVFLDVSAGGGDLRTAHRLTTASATGGRAHGAATNCTVIGPIQPRTAWFRRAHPPPENGPAGISWRAFLGQQGEVGKVARERIDQASAAD
jgi:hypothetical protein